MYCTARLQILKAEEMVFASFVTDQNCTFLTCSWGLFCKWRWLQWRTWRYQKHPGHRSTVTRFESRSECRPPCNFQWLASNQTWPDYKRKYNSELISAKQASLGNQNKFSKMSSWIRVSLSLFYIHRGDWHLRFLLLSATMIFSQDENLSPFLCKPINYYIGKD